MFLLMNFRVLFPLAVVWLICLLQERSSDMLRPRYLVFLAVWSFQVIERARNCMENNQREITPKI